MTHSLTNILKFNYIQKTGKNTFQNYKYATAEDAFKLASEALHECDLHISRTKVEFLPVRENEYIEVIKGKTSEMRLVFCKVTITVSNDKGETVAVHEGIGSAADSGDKMAMKAETAARKYAIAHLLNLSWGDDPEADPIVDKEVDFSGERKKLVLNSIREDQDIAHVPASEIKELNTPQKNRTKSVTAVIGTRTNRASMRAWLDKWRGKFPKNESDWVDLMAETNEVTAALVETNLADQHYHKLIDVINGMNPTHHPDEYEDAPTSFTLWKLLKDQTYEDEKRFNTGENNV